ncbi:hypothetical protein SAMN05444390_1011011 [Marinobacterium lutimaris]|uniref:EAL domain, c-di-GMP-specific phosphodiesterase class I (Or its enzymatically inactive variant) n=2 Tax=Marinobacterium lutimaris TaxID=568106 RepID=A0A1H5WDF1_9GAMM|nr:hypothetical protein SAMN05444390_1011011 [Marinobacterium lutimaris]
MPLTYIVKHLNRRLRELHPDSVLAEVGRIGLEPEGVSAQIQNIKLTPVHSSVFSTTTFAHFANNSELRLNDPSGALSGQRVYLQAWNGSDIIFLDRLIRTLQCLHYIYLNLGNPPKPPLILDIHTRHIEAVPKDHGLVFESLLHSLGLSPCQIILRLNLSCTTELSGLAGAIENFRDRGYGLLLHCEHLTGLCVDAQNTWEQNLRGIRALGIGYLEFRSAASGAVDYPAAMLELNRIARAEGFATLLIGLTDRLALQRALDDRFDGVEGPVFGDGEQLSEASSKAGALGFGLNPLEGLSWIV